MLAVVVASTGLLPGLACIASSQNLLRGGLLCRVPLERCGSMVLVGGCPTAVGRERLLGSLRCGLVVVVVLGRLLPLGPAAAGGLSPWLLAMGLRLGCMVGSSGVVLVVGLVGTALVLAIQCRLAPMGLPGRKPTVAVAAVAGSVVVVIPLRSVGLALAAALAVVVGSPAVWWPPPGYSPPAFQRPACRGQWAGNLQSWAGA